MGLSQTEALEHIAAEYEAALSGLEQDDLDRVRQLLDSVDDLTEILFQGPPLSRETQDLWVKVQGMHGKLLTTMTAERSQIHATLQEAQKGRRALKSYGGKGSTTGTQWESLG